MQHLFTLILIVFSSISVAQKGKLTSLEKEKIKDAKVIIVAYEHHVDPFVTMESVVGKGNKAELKVSNEDNPSYSLTRVVLDKVDSVFKSQLLTNQAKKWPKILRLDFREQLKEGYRLERFQSDYLLELILYPFFVNRNQYTLSAQKEFALSYSGLTQLVRLADKKVLWRKKINIDGKKNKDLKFGIKKIESVEGEAFTQGMIQIIAQEFAIKTASAYEQVK